MNHLDITQDLPNLNNKLAELVEKSKSVQEQRLIDFCSKSPEKEDLNNICSVLNNNFNDLLVKKGIDFKLAFSKIENPIGKIS